MENRQLAVLGATGKVGAHVVRQALNQGLQVTALVRDPARLAPDLLAHPGLTVVTGGLGDRDAVARTVAGATCVVSAVGVRYRGGNPFKGLEGPQDVVPTAVASVLAVAQGRPRLVLLSAFGVRESWSALPGIVRLVIRSSALRHSYAALAQAEELALGGHLPVSIVRAVTLSDAPGTGQPARRPDLTAPPRRGSAKVSRQDVAALLLAQALRADAAPQAVLVAA